MPVDMKALLARERERRRAAASGEPAGAATASSSAAATAPEDAMAPRAKISLRDFDVGERAGVRGLHYVPDFISPDEERAILAGIHAPGAESRWVRSGRRRVANYGGVPSSSEVTEPLPPFAASLLRAIADAGIVDERTTMPNHVLVNEYVAPAGISPHNDGDVYHPHVAIVTLEGAALMDFWPNDGSVTADDDRAAAPDRDERTDDPPSPIAQVLLRPRSLLLYTGDAYGLRHGIRHADVDGVTDRCVNAEIAGVAVGDEVRRGRVRYSVVFVRKGR